MRRACSKTRTLPLWARRRDCAALGCLAGLRRRKGRAFPTCAWPCHAPPRRIVRPQQMTDSGSAHWSASECPLPGGMLRRSSDHDLSSEPFRRVGAWNAARVSIAIDCASRCVLAARLSPKSTTEGALATLETAMIGQVELERCRGNAFAPDAASRSRDACDGLRWAMPLGWAVSRRHMSLETRARVANAANGGLPAVAA